MSPPLFLPAVQPLQPITQVMDQTWAENINPPLPIDTMERARFMAEATPETFVRLDATVERVVGLKTGVVRRERFDAPPDFSERGFTPRERIDPVALVAAHGTQDIFTLQHLVKRGVRVVSREMPAVHDFLRERFAFVSEALTQGQLVFSAVGEAHPDTRYDLAFWPHPPPRDGGWRSKGGYDAVTPEMLTENLAQGALIFLQTDDPWRYFRGLKKLHFSLRWCRSNLHERDYLFPSLELRRRPVQVGVFSSSNKF
ncbi:MAG: hypothetical protein Q7T03_11095 [Deltaproteobacteria bacterium]|nr:hypothetical protein [Deltaproteobacteria bacterium]